MDGGTLAWLPGPARRRLVLAGFAVAVAGLAYLGWAAAARPAGPVPPAHDAVQVGVLLTAAMLCLLRAALVRQDRLAWAALGAGIAAWATGEAVWVTVIRDRVPPPYPSVADAGYLLFYPLAYVTVVRLVRSRSAGTTGAVWLDGAVAGLGASAVALALVYEPVIALTGGSTATVAAGLAYPLTDVVLLGLVALALAVAGFRERTWWLLAAGTSVLAAADVVWLLRTAAGTYAVGGWPDAGWPLAAVLLAAAAWQRPVPLRTIRLDGWHALAMPAAGLVAALVVLAVASRRPVPGLAVGLALACVLGTIARAALAYRDVQHAAPAVSQAVTDDLTGLANRRLLLRRLDAALDTGSEPYALVLLDLDRFKEVNDTLGHPVGDELLRRLGPRLAGTARPGETVARLGGDEFAVLLPGVAGEEEALRAGRRVLAGLLGAYVIDGLTLFVTASAGVALAPEHGVDGPTLLRCADVAMYQAKRSGGDVAVYRPRTDPHSRTRLEAATALRRAIGDGDVVCHYQPQVDVATGVTVGMEALARWDDPRRGLVPPEDFLGLAEQTGLMPQLFDTVLRTALADCRRWREQVRHVRVAVNLAASSLLDSTLATRVSQALELAGLPTEALALEITEGPFADAGRAREALAALHGMGVRVALDDYGTGRSSIALLKELPVDQIKLHGELVGTAAGDRRARAILRHTVLMAHSLNIEVVAEGVEDGPTLRVLDELGCDLAQGFHVAAPMPAAAALGWLGAPRPGAAAVHG